MPEKRQPISAACRFSAAFPWPSPLPQGIDVMPEILQAKKTGAPEDSRFLMTPTNHFAW
jgi:hypothetical protein